MTRSTGSPAPPSPIGRTPAWPSASVIGVGVSAISARPRVRFAVRVAEVVAGVVFVLLTLSPESSRHAVGLVGALVSGLAWLVWVLVGTTPGRSLGALAALSAAGGVCAAGHASGGVFVFVATAATAFSFSLPIAVVIFAAAPLGFLTAGLAIGDFPGHAGSLLAVGLLGLVLGQARRELVARAQETTLLATAERRAALADRERQLVTERNRLGRDIHDVLAHTLGAVSIQLTALDARLDAGDDPGALKARIRSLHALVGDGLKEAGDAVRALRDDALSLEAQIRRLAALHRAEVTQAGIPYPLRADRALALYRVVQEALTNAAKHAPGAAVRVGLSYDETAVTVIVENSAASQTSTPLAVSGGGHGIDGMHARVEIAGGRSSAGPHAGGWRVTATLPRR